MDILLWVLGVILIIGGVVWLLGGAVIGGVVLLVVGLLLCSHNGYRRFSSRV